MAKMVNEVKLVDKKVVDIPINNLHVQFVPAANPWKFWHGYDMMALRTSPHVEILEMYVKHGFNKELFMQTSYFKERQERRTIHGRTNWTDKYIFEHINNRIKIYDSLKKKGYKHKLHKYHPILVLKTPFWETRFGEKHDGVVGPEILDGAGRCSAAYVLGWKTIPGMWVEDRSPGTKKCKVWEGKFKSL